MNMNPVIAVIGLLLLFAWALETWGRRRAGRRRNQDHARERDNLRHITGAARPWWREPPEDGPEGDH